MFFLGLTFTVNNYCIINHVKSSHGYAQQLPNNSLLTRQYVRCLVHLSGSSPFQPRQQQVKTQVTMILWSLSGKAFILLFKAQKHAHTFVFTHQQLGTFTKLYDTLKQCY